MAISDELTLLASTKASIKNSINAKGGNITNDTPFADYASAITNLPSGGDQSTLRDLIEGDITSIDIPSGTTKIRSDAFYNCTYLSSVTIPNTVTEIGQRAFSFTALTSISIPSSVTSIGSQAFSNCTRATSVTIPSSVNSIGNSAFSGCIALTAIVVERTTPATLGTNAFNNTNDCPIYVPFNSVSAYKTAWSAYSSRIQGLAMKFTPSGGGAVIMAGNSDAYIRRDEVPSDILNGTGSLEICDGMYATAFYTSGSTRYGTFNQCTGLTSVTFPDSLEEIQDWSFRQCTNLSSVTFGNGLAAIGVSGFIHTAVTSLVFPDSLEEIGNYAFEDCTELQTVTLGSGIRSIGDEAFAIYTTGLTGSLTTVTCWASTPPTLGTDVFLNQNNLAHIYVPAYCVGDYQNASGWGYYYSIIEAIPSTMLDGESTYSLGYDPNFEAVINYEGTCTCSGKDWSGIELTAYDSTGVDITSGLTPTFTMTGAPTGWSASDLQTLESWLMDGISWDYGEMDCIQTDDETGECVDFNYGWLLDIEPGAAPSFEDASLYGLIGTNWGLDMTVTIDGTSITKHIGLQLSSGSLNDWIYNCEDSCQGGGDEPEPEPDPEEEPEEE